jgi:hypothetical protein
VSPLKGDAVTPLGVTEGHPGGDSVSPPTFGMNQEPRTSSLSEDSEERARASFDELFASWTKVDPDKASRPRTWDAFLAAIDRGDASPEAIAAAGMGYLASLGGRKPAMLHFWLKDELFAGRVAAAQAKVAAERTRFADASVRASMLGAAGEDFVHAYLDPAAWNGERRVITARTNVAATKLREKLGWLFVKLGVSVANPERTADG